MNLLEGLERKLDPATTLNGAPTNSTTYSACLDLFVLLGTSDGVSDKDECISAFHAAWAEDTEVTTNILLYTRDILEGAGRREISRVLFNELEVLDPKCAKMFAHLMVERGIGRFDDILYSKVKEVQEFVFALLMREINNGNRLVFKWLPRVKANSRCNTPKAQRKNNIARWLRNKLHMDSKTYNRFLSKGTVGVIEHSLCSKNYDNIIYDAIPAVAMSRYTNALERHDPEGFAEYIKQLQNGEKTAHVKTLYPHDIVVATMQAPNPLHDLQWAELQKTMPKIEGNILPVIDVSGSMTNFNVTKSANGLQVATGLGIFLAGLLTGPYKNKFISFSTQPSVVDIDRDTHTTRRYRENETQLGKRIIKAMSSDNVGYSTSLYNVFRTLLDFAEQQSCPPEDMPTHVLVLSDMEFDDPDIGGDVIKTTHAHIKELYAQHDRVPPVLVYWNLDSREGNMPITKDDTGTVLVSGYSVNVLNAVLKNNDPLECMFDVLNKERYKYDLDLYK